MGGDGVWVRAGMVVGIKGWDGRVLAMVVGIGWRWDVGGVRGGMGWDGG